MNTFDTKTVNLRNLPLDLVSRAKARAAMEHISLRELFLRAVTELLDGPMTHARVQRVVVVPPAPDVAPAPPTAPGRGVLTICPACGGMTVPWGDSQIHCDVCKRNFPI